MRKYLTEDEGWYSFYKKYNTSLYVEKAGYFDERPQVHISLTQIVVIVLLPLLLFFSWWFLLLAPFMFIGWGKMYVNLPIKTGIQDCESAAWGFNYHDNTIWWYTGGGGNFSGGKKWKTFVMPWNLEWYRTSLLLKDDTWDNEFKGDRKDYYDDTKWGDKKWSIQADYLDRHNNKTVSSTIYVYEREWRRKGLMKLPLVSKLFNRVSKSLDISFSEEVGSVKGSWKGGTIGRSTPVNAGESIMECIERNGFSSLSYRRDSKIDSILNG
jgi:hypothetical protein